MIGAFASSSQNSFGIGKIVDINRETATIEYFISISNRVEKQVVRKSVMPKVPGDQTRCYVWSTETQTWSAGRIGQCDASDRTYEVSFPNKRARYVPEKEIYVRCNTPVEDPTETLALRCHETPYFHDRRQSFVRCITTQRAKSQGMTGLLSANIQLYPHQTEVVRRVLEDPVQRYLLADEVGLGKTIEAGAILRQYLLDEPSKTAIVLAPETLVEQWAQELEEKINITDFGQRVEIISTSTLDLELRNSENLGFLIIDEAHHIAAGAYEPMSSQHRVAFDRCKLLAHRAKQLLLLSATPVLHNENNFLAMLHLLDPVTYRLEDFEAFRERVSMRQDIGRILLSFRANSAAFVIKTTVNRLRSVFPNDSSLNVILNQLQSLMESDISDTSKQNQLIRSIRTHISETYRLHRRMLRNRRELVDLPARLDPDRTAADLKEEYDDDDRVLTIHDLIDTWRGKALQFTTGLDQHEEKSEIIKNRTRRLFAILVRASGTLLGVLEKVLLVRLSRASRLTIIREFNEEECDEISDVPLFPGEFLLLEEMLEVVQGSARGLDRLELLKEMLRPIKVAGTKAVVFTSFESVQQEIVQMIKSEFGSNSVSSQDSQRAREEIDADRKRFQETANCFVLVSDATGEEGLNLQFADWIIHFDLPWSPNRLEQRIGRLDRIGRNRSVRTRTLLGADTEETMFEAWYRMLRDGLGIFKKSIAGLQFYIDKKMPELETILFEEGSAGLLHSIPQIQREIEIEELKINEQNALDEIDMLEAKGVGYFAELHQYDEHHQPIQKAYEEWATEVLRFRRTYDDLNSDIVSYSTTEDTLVPKDVLREQFAHVRGVPGTYSRAAAVSHPGKRLFRIGEPFTQALSRYVRFDDRGQAFMMWRQLKNWERDEVADWAGFRFNFIIEANLRGAKKILRDRDFAGVSLKALSRRADAFFPPFTYTNFLDLNYQEVIDEGLLKILSMKYVKEGSTRNDYNLNFERSEAIDHLVDPREWANKCKLARSKSEAIIRASSRFQTLCKGYAIRTKNEMEKRVDQLRLRSAQENRSGINSQTISDDLALEEELQNALIQGVRKPQVRLDSIGFLVVSGRPPGI